jgi:hypothetical protein
MGYRAIENNNNNNDLVGEGVVVVKYRDFLLKLSF